MMSIEEIKNYCKVNDLLSLGGQPSEDQLRLLARDDFKVVINLATINPRYSLENEAASARALSMTYYHVPVDWGNPTEDDFESFENIFRQLSGEKTFVHCASNFRASAFYALYALKHLGWSDQQADALMAPIWDGSNYPTWENFINEMKASMKRMQYKFVTEDVDYSDLASGRVFHSIAGHPAFPIRLASEILQRCQAIRAASGAAAGSVLYDPCCGAAYHLSVLAYLHRELLSEVIGSDVDARAVALAGQNLGLLHPHGLDGRIAQIEQLFAQYGKTSHHEALTSAAHLRKRISAFAPLKLRTFCASALDADALAANLQGTQVDIVFTDIPYGQHSQWQGAQAAPVAVMLEALLKVLSPTSVVAIASDKLQKVTHEGYQRVDHFQIGKRRVVILKPIK